MRSNPHGRKLLALGVASSLVLAGCSDDPVDVHVDEEIERVELVISGLTVASWDVETMSWTGALNVDVGTETAHIDVVFLSHDGDEIVFDPDHYLDVEVADQAIAEFEQDTPGEFGGHLHGVQVGTTTVTFFLMHGAIGSGHQDFQTNPGTGNPGVTANVN